MAPPGRRPARCNRVDLGAIVSLVSLRGRTHEERVTEWVTGGLSWKNPVQWRRMPTSRRTQVLATLLMLSACASAETLVSADGLLPLGNYGGENAGMIVGDTATHLHIGCTYGDVSGRIALDQNGQFDVAGSYMLRAYPIAVGPAVPARFVGRLQGSTVVVTVTVNDTVQKAIVVKGPASVTYGVEPKDMPCPICRRPILSRSLVHGD